MTRNELLGEAVDRCMEELYQYARPKVTWKDFIQQNKEYSKRYKEWEADRSKESRIDSIGPAPYEFYYLPKDILKDIVDNYVRIYKMDEQQNLLDIIETLKNYCKEPIVDKYIEGENGFPGYRGYDHPDNLEKELTTLIKMYCDDSEADFIGVAKEVQSKFFEFLDMAGKFYNWNRELNAFYQSVYLGCSPHSNKETVISNWKKYRGEDIEINEEEIKREFYGEED